MERPRIKIIMTETIDKIKTYIQESINAKSKLLSSIEILENLEEASSLLVKIFQKKGKIILIGNGGSAADAQHLAAEFITRLNFDRPSLPALALTTDSSVITAISNDYKFDQIFARQLGAVGYEGDALIAISTSGNSPNIVEASIKAKEMGIHVVSMTGMRESRLSQNSDICINVPSIDTARIQEMHILVGHIICTLVENKMYGKKYS